VRLWLALTVVMLKFPEYVTLGPLSGV
jgi:hypothetical protein